MTLLKEFMNCSCSKVCSYFDRLFSDFLKFLFFFLPLTRKWKISNHRGHHLYVDFYFNAQTFSKKSFSKMDFSIKAIGRLSSKALLKLCRSSIGNLSALWNTAHLSKGTKIYFFRTSISWRTSFDLSYEEPLLRVIAQRRI